MPSHAVVRKCPFRRPIPSIYMNWQEHRKTTQSYLTYGKRKPHSSWRQSTFQSFAIPLQAHRDRFRLSVSEIKSSISLHSLSHSGIRATQRLIRSRFVWCRKNADIRDWARACAPCQRAKVHRYRGPPLQRFLQTDQRFAVVPIDIVGPLPPCQGYRYLSTCVDRFT